MAPIAPLARRKTDASMEDRKCSVACMSKELMDTIKTPNDDSESGPSRYASRGEESP